MNMDLLLLFLAWLFEDRCFAQIIMKFKVDTPPIMYSNFDLVTIGDDLPGSQIRCAFLCTVTDNCTTYKYMESNNLEKRCYNTTPDQFMGHVNTFYNGELCTVNWNSNKNSWLSSMRDDAFPDGSVVAAKNYCRDPRQEGYLWCPLDRHMQNQTSYRYESCNIPRCMTSNCRLYSRLLEEKYGYFAVAGVKYFIPDN